MIYKSDTFYIESLKSEDALQLNKLLVSNTERFKRFLPKTLAANRTLESSKSYVARKIKAHKAKLEFIYTLKDMKTKEIAGLIILKNLDWEKKQGEFAYCLGKRFEGRGWMSEAIKAASQYALDKFGLETLQILAHRTNLKSVKVAENSGFQWVETLENDFAPENEPALNMELYERYHAR